MPRRARDCPPVLPVHVVQRENNRQTCSASDALGRTRASRSRAYRVLFSSDLDAAVITDIRQALNTGLDLGNDKFRKEIEHLTGQRQRPLKRGPFAGFKSTKNQGVITLTPNIVTPNIGNNVMKELVVVDRICTYFGYATYLSEIVTGIKNS